MTQSSVQAASPDPQSRAEAPCDQSEISIAPHQLSTLRVRPTEPLRRLRAAETLNSFAVKAEQEGSAFVAIPGVDLNEILCVQEDRQVDKDNTVVFARLRLQIPPSPLRPHFVKARVRVRRYHDGTHAIFHGPRCLARYDADGVLQDETKQAA
jgi:hypothetical protein